MRLWRAPARARVLAVSTAGKLGEPARRRRAERSGQPARRCPAGRRHAMPRESTRPGRPSTPPQRRVQPAWLAAHDASPQLPPLVSPAPRPRVTCRRKPFGARISTARCPRSCCAICSCRRRQASTSAALSASVFVRTVPSHRAHHMSGHRTPSPGHRAALRCTRYCRIYGVNRNRRFFLA